MSFVKQFERCIRSNQEAVISRFLARHKPTPKEQETILKRTIYSRKKAWCQILRHYGTDDLQFKETLRKVIQETRNDPLSWGYQLRCDDPDPVYQLALHKHIPLTF